MRTCVALIAAAVAVVLSQLVLAQAAPEAPAVGCLNVGDGAEAGRLVSIAADKVTLARDGAEAAFPLAAFREIAAAPGQAGGAPQPAPALRLPPPWTIWADKGDVLMAREVKQGAAPGTVDITGYGWEATGVPLVSVRALAAREVMSAPSGREAFEAVCRSPPTASDRVAIASGEGEQILSCVVDGVSAAGLKLVPAPGAAAETVPAGVRWAQVRWAVLSPGARPPERATGHMVELSDGTRFRAQSLDVRDGALAAEDAGARFALDAPLGERLARIQVYSDAYRYLSDLTPEKVTSQPFLDVVWPPCFDRSLFGGPLSLAGKAYVRGIGMDARTEMTFALGRAWSRFYATVGVDDGAGGAQGRSGRVILRAFADERLIYESGPLGRGGPPQALSLDVGGADKLTLVTDFGSRASAGGDFADWADARVAK